MLALLQEVIARSPDDHFYLSDRKARAMRAGLESLAPDAPDYLLWEIHLKLAEEEQWLGNERAAIDHFEEAHRILPSVEEDLGARVDRAALLPARDGPFALRGDAELRAPAPVIL